ncbi:MAG: hypothetical protein ACOC9P_00965 [bacterium]
MHHRRFRSWAPHLAGLALLASTLPATAGAVELTLHARGADAGVHWPVTFGVPFPEGDLQPDDLNTLRLTGPDGAAPSVQVRPTAHWLDGSVQWVLVDAQVPLPETSANYRLHWREASSTTDADEPSSAIAYRETDDAVMVDTGALRFGVDKNRLVPLKQVEVLDDTGQWTPLFPEGEHAELYLQDGDGQAYRGSLARKPTVEIEERGPRRVSIKLEGWMASSDGRRLGRRIVRIYAFAGMKTLRIFDTFVNTADTQQVKFSNISLHLPYKGDRYQFHDTAQRSAATVRDSAYLHQYDHDAYELITDGQSPRTGTRAPGRVTVSESDSAYSVTWRHFWEMHPNEMEVTPGQLSLHFWPRHSKAADYRDQPEQVRMENITRLEWVHEGEVLDFTTPDAVLNFEHPDYQQDYRFNVLRNLAQKDNAMGVARTSEYWLDFHGSASEPADVTARADAFEAHPLMLADSDWMAASGAYWNIAARSEHYPQVEDGPERMLDFIFDTMYPRVQGYGKWTFGAYNNSYFPTFDFAWVHRAWNVFYHGGTRWPWLTLARTGDPRFFTYAERFARHLMDVSVSNWEDRRFNAKHWDHSKRFWEQNAKYRGAQASCVGLVPWYDGASNAFDCDVDYALWYYYLTGYQRAYDVALMQGEFLLREEALLRRDKEMPSASQFPDPNIFPSKEAERAYFERHRGSIHDLLTPGRQGTAPGAAALHLYRATHDKRYLMMAERIMDHYRQLEDEHGNAFTQHYYAPFAVRYWEVTKDESLKPYIIKWARDRMQRDGRPWHNRDTHYHLYALAYQFTHDTAFLERGLAQTQVVQDNRFAGLGEPFDGVPYWVGLPSGIGYTGQQWGHFVRALNEHHRRTGERLLPPGLTQAHPFTSFVSSAKRGGQQKLILHLRKSSDESVGLRLRFNSKGNDRVACIVLAPDGSELTDQRIQAESVQGKAMPNDAEGEFRVRLPRSAPAGDYRILLVSSSRVDLHWPHRDKDGNTYRKLVAETPVNMGQRSGPDLRVFMPSTDELEVTVPKLYMRSFATYRLYNANGEEVFAQTGTGTTNTPARFTIPVPREQRNRPWFYRRSPSQSSAGADDLHIEGTLPIQGFSKEAFFVPESFKP